ncbi:MAG: hypothetical protein ABI700_14730, partial [Chloroflexota bacterium]
ILVSPSLNYIIPASVLHYSFGKDGTMITELVETDVSQHWQEFGFYERAWKPVDGRNFVFMLGLDNRLTMYTDEDEFSFTDADLAAYAALRSLLGAASD